MVERQAVPNSQKRSKQKEKKKNSKSSTKRVEDKGADADPGNRLCNCKKGGNVIQCDACCRWCHPSCVNLSSAVINALKVDVQYFCPLCVLKRFSKDKDDNATINQLRQEIADLRKIVDNLKKPTSNQTNEKTAETPETSSLLTKIQKDIDDLNVSVERLTESASTQQTPSEEGCKAQQRILESHEHALRSNNAILIGLSEDESRTTHEIVQTIFTEKLEETEISFEARRLGKKGERNPHPILVKFSDSRNKVAVMRKRKLLKGSRIYINDDLTPLQKQNMKVLLQKMRHASKERW
jgi:hypothetical protein